MYVYMHIIPGAHELAILWLMGSWLHKHIYIFTIYSGLALYSCICRLVFGVIPTISEVIYMCTDAALHTHYTELMDTFTCTCICMDMYMCNLILVDIDYFIRYMYSVCCTWHSCTHYLKCVSTYV